jgi:phospholipid transport system substrate-binding protein
LKYILTAMAIVVLLASGVRAQASVSPNGAEAVVRELQDNMLGILKRTSGEAFERRVDALCPLLSDKMDVKLQSAMAVGRGVWNGWSDDQRSAYTSRFRQYLCAIYASRFRDFDGQSLVVVGSRPGPAGAVIVNSEVRIPEEAAISIDYVMRQKPDQSWKVADLYLSGRVSEVALRRSEFANVLRSQGFDALLAAIEKKTAAQAAAPPR